MGMVAHQLLRSLGHSSGKLVQPRRNKSEGCDRLKEGDQERGEKEHAISTRNPCAGESLAARPFAPPRASLDESRAAGSAREDYASGRRRSEHDEDRAGPA